MSATLRAKHGAAEIAIELLVLAGHAGEPGFEAAFHLSEQHWDGEHTHPLSASIEGLWLCSAALVELQDHISGWARRPLDGLDPDGLNGNFELARLPGQSIRMSFGSRPDTIARLDPVVTVFFSAGALRGEFHFVVDQSCLALFVRELSGEMTRAGASGGR